MIIYIAEILQLSYTTKFHCTVYIFLWPRNYVLIKDSDFKSNKLEIPNSKCCVSLYLS